MYQKALQLLKKMVGEEGNFHDDQWEAIESALSGRKTLVVEKTGWGKSVVYFIASKLLHERDGGTTILISPLLSLIRNQIEAAEKMGLVVVTINSSNRESWTETEELLASGKCDLLLISPERLSNKDFVQRVIPTIKNGINMVVVDEAHCISDWGHDFRPAYRRIVDILNRMAGLIPVLATTATANDRVIKDIEEQIQGNLEIIRGPLMRESLKIQVIHLQQQSERMAWLKENIPNIQGSGIIYCLTTSGCEKVAKWLQGNGIKAMPYHSKLSSNEEENTNLKKYREQQLINNEIKVLVSTVALGMGFDKSDITFVIHYQTPSNIIKYYQEIGRAGRKVDSAYAILLVGEEAEEINKYFIENSFPAQQELEKVLETIEHSESGLSQKEIESVINISSRKLSKCLLFLQLYGIVDKQGAKYNRTLNKYNYGEFGFEEIKDIRYKELAFMSEYVHSTTCYMKQVANELDDKSETECGRCKNCVGHSLLTDQVTEEGINAAQLFLKHDYLKIISRKQIPAGVLGDRQQNLNIHEQNEEGRILCTYGDAGWGKIVAKNKYEDNCFGQELIDATAYFIEYEWKIKDDIDCIMSIPSLRRPILVTDFAKEVAKKLKVRYEPAIIKVENTPEQKKMENNWQQAKNVYTAFEVNGYYEDQNILLIDDIVDSKWTLTICGKKLKDAKANKVYPFALASTSKV